MKYKRIGTIGLIFILLISIFFSGGCSKNEIQINDNSGTSIARLSTTEISDDNTYRSYLEIVISEAINIVSDINKCNSSEAESILFNEQYIIDTVFDSEIFDEIEKSYLNSETNGEPFGCAVTDLQGNLCAVYSSESDESFNYASTAYSPYSTIKPLSVYAPAIEAGVANWSKVYEDSPYKQIADDDGNMVNWPENANGIYSGENTSIYNAVKESLNTVAVKCLDEYGVLNSIEFLKSNFNINLDYEYQKAIGENENEVIGNISMGYLYKGVSPIDMAGYYQIFANGGKYFEPKTIRQITDSQGNIIYKSDDSYKQVLSESTAYIMNKMLQGVTQRDATGADAKLDDVPVGGKTGTGTANDCHWFVGFVPEYSCAVWHGGDLEKNYSPEIFNNILTGMDLNVSKAFPVCSDVKQLVYCNQSGLICSEKCKKIDVGYYFASDNIETCEIH